MRQSFVQDSHISSKFLIVVPLLSEVDRISNACPNLHFKSPIPVHGQKLYDLARLIEDGENVVTTHALFKLLNRDIYGKLKGKGYTLIIDEVLECVDLFNDLTKNDRDVLFKNQMVFVNPINRRLCWNHAQHPNYSGRFDQIRYLCDTGSLVSVNDKVLIWEFPSEFLRCFREVYVCTYLFRGSPFYTYLMAEGFSLTFKSVRNGGLMERAEDMDDRHIRSSLIKLINVYEGPMNAIGREKAGSHPLSSSWYKRAKPEDLRHLKSSTEAFFSRHAQTPSALNCWTTFSDHRNKLKGKGYTKGWIANDAKGTNEYADKASMAYLCNFFYHPVLKGYFASRGILVDEDLYALSALIQWVWRSRIRNGEPISLYVPSERMRKLLEAWLEGRLPLSEHELPMAA